MKIKEIQDEQIIFDNGETIGFRHYADCCEWNYADFNQLDDIARNATFTSPLTFEKVEESGFRFGNQPNRMFFVPCYSEQNGYYSSDLTILYNGKEIIEFEDLEII